MVHHKILIWYIPRIYSSVCYTIVPCSLFILCIWQFASANPRLPLGPSSTPASLGTPQSVSLTLFCFIDRFICVVFQVPHLSDVIWYFSFSYWLTSLCMIISSCIHVAENDIICSFLWLSSIPLYRWTTSLYVVCFKLMFSKFDWSFSYWDEPYLGCILVVCYIWCVFYLGCLYSFP